MNETKGLDKRGIYRAKREIESIEYRIIEGLRREKEDKRRWKKREG